MYKEGQNRMKKITLILTFGAICASILSGCKSKKKYKAPTTPHDKVAVAFNGVESSFANYKNNYSTSSARTRSTRKVGQSDSSGALSDIASIYTSYDSQGDRIDELDYDEYPMIQFQCLKRTFDYFGENYDFGTKYAKTMNGTIYFNPATGDKREINDVFKYEYSFNLSLQIDMETDSIIFFNETF